MHSDPNVPKSRGTPDAAAHDFESEKTGDIDEEVNQKKRPKSPHGVS
jgi:hypothetical protein